MSPEFFLLLVRSAELRYTLRYQNKETHSGTRMFRFQTEMMNGDAGGICLSTDVSYANS